MTIQNLKKGEMSVIGKFSMTDLISLSDDLCLNNEPFVQSWMGFGFKVNAGSFFRGAGGEKKGQVLQQASTSHIIFLYTSRQLILNPNVPN